jgi:hypothetical protein
MKGLQDLSDRSKSQRVKDAVDDIFTALADSASSDRFRRYLSFAARIPGRSEMNRLLLAITLIRREAVPQDRPPYFLGFKAWGKYHRRVKKGEHGYFVLAPIRKKVTRPVKQDSAPSPASQPSSTEEKAREFSILVGFRGAWVFELAQTEPDCRTADDKIVSPCCGACETCTTPFAPPEDFFRPLDGSDPSGLFDVLAQMAASRGFPVKVGSTVEAIGHFVHGVTRFSGDPSRRCVVIDDGSSERMRTATMAHELSHVVLHDPFSDPDSGDLPETMSDHRNLAEVEAESLAYLLLSAAGFADEDLLEATGDYAASWTKGNPDLLIRALSRVLKVYAGLEHEMISLITESAEPVSV